MTGPVTPGAPVLSLHLLRRRRHDFGDPAVMARGKQALFNIAQHRFDGVSKHVGRGRREREHPARQIAYADLLAGLDLDHVSGMKPRAPEKARKVPMACSSQKRWTSWSTFSMTFATVPSHE